MSTDVQKFLEALLSPFQVLEDAFQQLLFDRTIDTAVGVQLDIIGKWVGRARDGITDDEIYRRYVRAQIATNKSDGLIEDLITIADLVVYEEDAIYRVLNYGGGSLHLSVEGVAITYPVAEILISFLRKAVGAGIRVVLEFLVVESADSFAFDDGDDGLGFGDANDAATGGGLASAIE